MSTADQNPKPSRGRTVALVISLAFNVLFVGVIIVGLMRAVNRAFISQPGGVLGPGAVMRVLPEERRPAIHDIQLKHQDAMRAERRAARRARLEAFRVFAATPFDPTAFDKALSEVEDADRALEEEAIAMVKDVVGALTPEERKLVTEKARKRGPWWRPELRD